MKYILNLLFVIQFIFIEQTNIIAQSNQTFFLGHSLVNFHIPNMVNKMSIAASDNFSYNANIGIGANLSWHYTQPSSGQGDQWNLTLNQGGFENFVITEAVPLKGHLQWSGTYRYTDSLYLFSQTYNPDIQYYIYETWHCINSGTPTGCEWDNDDHISWRNRLSQDLSLWEGIADSINLLHEKDMLIIPAGQALAKLYDRIQDGLVPGFSSINQLFTDDIHLTYTGNYFIACVMYAVLQKKSPVGLPNQLTDEWGGLYTDFPTPEQALVFQNIVWETITEYDRDGVEGSPLSILEVYADSKIMPSGQVAINWEIVHNDECAHFVVERSIDGKTFNGISENISISQTHKYTFIDYDAPKGVLYYRIKLVDCDLISSYIKVLKVDNSDNNSISLLNNMVSEILQFKMTADMQKCHFSIVDANGSKVYDRQEGLLSSGDIQSMDVSNLARGMYFLVLTEISINTQIFKFIKY
jgi:hypothetical protein